MNSSIGMKEGAERSSSEGMCFCGMPVHVPVGTRTIGSKNIRIEDEFE